ncbi:MAG: MFS family permease [Halieaceae bacterium]|jgi:MFS family permease
MHRSTSEQVSSDQPPVRMLAMLIPIAALLLSDALLLVGHGMLLTFLPIAAESAGLSDTQVALTGSAYFLGFVTGCLATPYIVRRVGHIRSFAILATSYSAVVLIFPSIPEFLGWLLLRFLVGTAISGLYMIIESWLNERSTKETRGTILSIYTVINLVMITVGQQMLNLADPSGQQLFSLAAILLSLAIIPVSLTLSLAPAPLAAVSINLPKVWRQSHVGLGGAIVSGLVTGAFWSLGPLYAKGQGFDTAQLTLFMSVIVVGGAVFQLPLGRISDYYDRRVVVFCAAVAASLISLLVVFLPALYPQWNAWLPIVLAFLWGGSVMTQYSICLAHANDRAEPEDFVMVGSGMLLTLGVCSAIGAPLASLTMRLLGPGGLFIFASVCMGIFATAIAARRRSNVLPLHDHCEESEVFRAATDMTTPAIFEMDPRTSEIEDTPPV